MIGTTSTPEKRELAMENGAEHVLLSTEDFRFDRWKRCSCGV